MPAEIMLVNPRKRRAKKRATAKRNPTRRRRTMTAAQAKYFGPRRRRRAAKRNPVRVRRARVASPRRARRRVRRNPISLKKFNPKSVLNHAVIPAAIGGAGALAVDVIWAMLPIPATFKSGAVGIVAKIAGAVAIGALAGKFVGGKTGEAITVGAVTVTAYDILKNFVRTSVPSLPLSEYISGIGYVQAGPYIDGGNVGEYVDGVGPAAYLADPNYSDDVF